MKLTIKSTDTLAMVDGVECRKWEGTAENGDPCTVWVYVIEVMSGTKQMYLHELREVRPPREIKEVSP